jgi:hypothetical protein
MSEHESRHQDGEPSAVSGSRGIFDLVLHGPGFPSQRDRIISGSSIHP